MIILDLKRELYIGPKLKNMYVYARWYRKAEMGQFYRKGPIYSAVETKYGNMGLMGHEVSLFGKFQLQWYSKT